jgi:hypothetical protein
MKHRKDGSSLVLHYYSQMIEVIQTVIFTTLEYPIS